MRSITGKNIARRRISRQHIAGIAIGIIVLSWAVPAIAAGRPGTITLTTPVSQSAIHKTVDVNWSWRTGTGVRSTSRVDVLISPNGFAWSVLATSLPIRSGTWSWDTTLVPNLPYALQVHVMGTTIKSVQSPIVVDNAAPEVQITRPAQGDVVVDDQTVAQGAVVVGTSTLVAKARDDQTGIASVSWFLDAAQIATGTTASYNFSSSPGPHTLTATATDGAGNTASTQITIYALPSSKVTEGPPPQAPGAPTPPAVPNPSQSPSPGAPGQPGVPSLPPAPDPSAIPSLLPSLPPLALPSR